MKCIEQENRSGFGAVQCTHTVSRSLARSLSAFLSTELISTNSNAQMLSVHNTHSMFGENPINSSKR